MSKHFNDFNICILKTFGENLTSCKALYNY